MLFLYLYIEPTNMLDMRAVIWLENYLLVYTLCTCRYNVLYMHDVIPDMRVYAISKVHDKTRERKSV